jgi:hypothetical protein
VRGGKRHLLMNVALRLPGAPSTAADAVRLRT